jgi:hypothetical protein
VFCFVAEVVEEGTDEQEATGQVIQRISRYTRLSERVPDSEEAKMKDRRITGKRKEVWCKAVSRW